MGVNEDKKKFSDCINQRMITVDYIYRCQNNFNPVRKLPDFTSVKRGDVIGIDAKKKIRAPYDGCVVLVKEAQKPGEEAFVLGRKKAF